MKMIPQLRIFQARVGGVKLQRLAICFLLLGSLTARAADAVPRPENDARPAQGAPGTNGVPAKLSIELRDGCLIVGWLQEKTLRFESDLLGKMQVPLELIARIEWPANQGTPLVSMANGDSMQAGLADKELLVHTAYGKLKVPRALIVRVQVSRG